MAHGVKGMGRGAYFKAWGKGSGRKVKSREQKTETSDPFSLELLTLCSLPSALCPFCPQPITLILDNLVPILLKSHHVCA